MTVKLIKSGSLSYKNAVQFSSLAIGDTFYLAASDNIKTRSYYVKRSGDMCVTFNMEYTRDPIGISDYLKRSPDTAVIPVDITLSIETSDTN